MRFADAGRPQQNDVLRPVDKTQSREFPDHLPIDRGLELKFKLVERLEPREPRELQPTFNPALLAAVPFDFQGAGEKSLIVQIAFGGLLTDAIELREQVLHLEAFEEVR